MPMPKVSIIIPVYNAQKWIAQCIESILNQTYSDFELILINDGSPDNSGKICESFAVHDSRIKVLHKQNGGVSSARNRGLDVAKGEYIGFIDADDWVSNNYIENLIKEEADLCISGYICEYIDVDTPSLICRPLFISTTDIREESSAIEELFYRDLLSGPFQKLFKNSIIDKYHLRFDERLSYGEDTLFVYKYFLEASSIFANPVCDYHYIIRKSVSLSKVIHRSENTRIFALNMFELLNNIGNKFGISSNRFIDNKYDRFLNFIFKGLYALYQKETTKSERYEFLNKTKNDLAHQNITVYGRKISRRNKIIYIVICKFPLALIDSMLKFLRFCKKI